MATSFRIHSDSFSEMNVRRRRRISRILAHRRVSIRSRWATTRRCVARWIALQAAVRSAGQAPARLTAVAFHPLPGCSNQQYVSRRCARSLAVSRGLARSKEPSFPPKNRTVGPSAASDTGRQASGCGRRELEGNWLFQSPNEASDHGRLPPGRLNTTNTTGASGSMRSAT